MRLTVETGPSAGTVHPLDREQPSYLGSAKDCAVVIDEAGVAGQHAVVKALRGEGFGIKALAPGLRVNGAAVDACPLADGDIIELGTTRLAYGNVQQQGLPTIAGYRILSVLGKGGMGIVYRAEQVSLHRHVALKVLSRELTQNPQFVAKFVAEARAAAKLQHNNVVAVFDVEHQSDLYYYAMELMQGSLEDELRRNGPLPQERALAAIADAAAGLAYAESLGIVHRDIKPDNLMLDQHGVVKIADLGLAHSDNDTADKAMGTPHFMAPEQVQKRDVDHRTDLYALGCTFYRLVTNRTPFRGQSVKDILRAQVKDEAEPAHKHNSEVSAEVSAIIARLMRKEPKERFQSANELLEAVRALLQPKARKGLWIGLAAVAALAASGAIYWAINKPKDVVTEKVYYDDPEKQRFADENAELKTKAREDGATIALLTARVSGLKDLELADALEVVARAHQGTKAEIEAQNLAKRLRADVNERKQRQAELAQKVQQHLAALQGAANQQCQAGEYQAALSALQQPPPAELAKEPTLALGIKQLEADVLLAAETELHKLQDQCKAAQARADLANLATSIQAIEVALQQEQRWPKRCRELVAQVHEQLLAGRKAVADLTQAAVAARWLVYRDTVVGQPTFAQALLAMDFAAAAAVAAAFAAAGPQDQASTHGRDLAEVLNLAAAFGDSLRAALAAAPVALPNAAEEGEVISAWQVSTGMLTIANPSKRGTKDRQLAARDLPPEQWLVVAAAVANPAPGTRECFLTLVALNAHVAAAENYLRRLDPRNDRSGTTNDDAYPLASNLLDRLRRDLPTGEHPWLVFVRQELDAALRVVAGLRGMSERRHLAAASHLERALADFSHSLMVLRLP